MSTASTPSVMGLGKRLRCSLAIYFHRFVSTAQDWIAKAFETSKPPCGSPSRTFKGEAAIKQDSFQ
jgi:hypothetical protein